MKYCLRIWQWEVTITVAPLTRKSRVIGPFMSQKTVSMTFFTDCYTQNFFFTREPVYLHFLTQACSSKLVFSPFVNIFQLKRTSLYTSHILL